MEKQERCGTEEMRNELAREVRHPMQISPAVGFSALVDSGFLIASIYWKLGGHDFDVSFFRSVGRLQGLVSRA
jgi:hypothetical protein